MLLVVGRGAQDHAAHTHTLYMHVCKQTSYTHVLLGHSRHDEDWHLQQPIRPGEEVRLQHGDDVGLQGGVLPQDGVVGALLPEAACVALKVAQFRHLGRQDSAVLVLDPAQRAAGRLTRGAVSATLAATGSSTPAQQTLQPFCQQQQAGPATRQLKAAPCTARHGKHSRPCLLPPAHAHEKLQLRLVSPAWLHSSAIKPHPALSLSGTP